jgi:hypothetical protein
MLHLGASYWAVKDNDFEAALREAELAIAIAREIENPSTLLSALCNIGGSLEHDDPVAARDAYEEAIEFARSGGTQPMKGVALIGIARIRARKGELGAALKAFRDGLASSNHVGFRPITAEVLGDGAEILLRSGEMVIGVKLSASVLEGALARVMTSMERNAAIRRELDSARGQLGTESYDAAFADGRAMSYDDMVTLVAGELDRILEGPRDA